VLKSSRSNVLCEQGLGKEMMRLIEEGCSATDQLVKHAEAGTLTEEIGAKLLGSNGTSQ
jgi:hypothetical protein